MAGLLAVEGIPAGGRHKLAFSPFLFGPGLMSPNICSNIIAEGPGGHLRVLLHSGTLWISDSASPP